MPQDLPAAARVALLRALRRFRLPRLPLVRHLLLAVAGGVLLFVITLELSPFDNYELGQIAAYAIAIAGLSLLTGVNGQISLGHGAFMAVGAYTLAELQAHQSVNFVLQLLAATAVAAAAGLVIAVPATRLQGPYLAGMTLLLALALPSLSDRYSSFFGGDQGLPATAPGAPGSLDPQRWLAWLQILAALVVLVLLANLLDSRFGRAFRAVRDDEVAAATLGIHVARTKVTAFMVSAACAGLAGALVALSTGVVSTGEFPLSLSIFLLAGMVIGGAGTLMGAWWGAIAVVYLPNQWSQSLAGAFHLGHLVSANLAVIIFGAALVLVMLLAPAGIQGALRWAAGRLAAWAVAGRGGGNVSKQERQDGHDGAVPALGDGGRPDPIRSTGGRGGA
ncbi:MAG TPA: branched-chain amino acid ABC transporter permease [Acidimicrobiales bacterium]|nr:branched-chain amino acid ABC transporter permease [Acidimicrobiales bacterium]